MDTRKFVRKPFEVEGVEVTAENMEELSTWCGGELRSSAGKDGRGQQRYIKVPVKKPLNDRQTKAYVGDWVVVASDSKITGFKVYTPKAFRTNYDELLNDMIETFIRMNDRGDQETRIEEEESGFPEELQLAFKQQ